MLPEILKKHGISKIAEELDLSDLEENKSPLRAILKKISERLEFFATIVEPIVQPESTFSNMHEYNAFTDRDRKEILTTYRKMMQLHRLSMKTELEFTENSCTDFIKLFLKQWPDLKRELSVVLKKMGDSWKSDSRIRLELGYMG